MEPTEAQVKEFWEKCGRKNVIFANGCCLHDDSNGHRTWLDLDLNNLFKYAVLKLSNLGYCVSVTYRDNEAVAEVIINDNEEETKAIAYDKDPALALFRALYPIVVKEKDEPACDMCNLW